MLMNTTFLGDSFSIKWQSREAAGKTCSPSAGGTVITAFSQDNLNISLEIMVYFSFPCYNTGEKC